ncbi:AFG1-like ATPase-domain-containing protein [Baffinella frigidus]|nr:AFG1-like ATPase-domain-containing protein [Cryptophyta sp. CCMP2293]
MTYVLCVCSQPTGASDFIAIAKAFHTIIRCILSVCSQPTGASDFIAIAKAFHTVILHNVPFLSMERLPEVRRLITFIDVLYDHHVKLLCRHSSYSPAAAEPLMLFQADNSSAAAEPLKLFQADKSAANDEAFAFDRTASRLNDMMSEEYKLKQHNPTAATMSEDIEEAAGVAELHHELCREERGRADEGDTTKDVESMSEEAVGSVDAIWNSYDKDGTGKLDKGDDHQDENWAG